MTAGRCGMNVNRRQFVGLSAAALAVPFVGRFNALAQEATPAAAAQPLSTYVLTTRGTLASATVEDARAPHNPPAGAPESIAAANSLGDVSHMVYTPVVPAASGA